MRTTDIRLAQHIQRGFKHQWLRQGRRKIASTGVEEVLAAKGIPVYDPKTLLSRPFLRNLEVISPREEVKAVKRSLIYSFHDIFSPPGGIAQVQQLTNSIVHPTLPEAVLGRVQDNSAEEDDKVQEAILHTHLLDSYQEKLPRIWDVISRPRWSYPREYGMPAKRKNYNSTYQLILLLEKLHPKAAERCLISKPTAQVTLQHSGHTFQMRHTAAFMLSSTKPLPSFFEGSEILTTEMEVLPDISPLSPFLHCKKSFKYSDKDYASIATKNCYPHTVVFHMNMPRMPHTDDSFGGVSLLKTFGHAAAYAKQRCKIDNGDLERPLVIQFIHTNGKKYHMGVLQLNTLNLSGAKRNIFWHHPMEDLFHSCSFKVAKPILEEYNPKVFSLLKALHGR